MRCLFSVGFCILYKKEEAVLPKTGVDGVCGNIGWNEKVSMSVVQGKGNKGIVSKGLEDPKFACVDETPCLLSDSGTGIRSVHARSTIDL